MFEITKTLEALEANIKRLGGWTCIALLLLVALIVFDHSRAMDMLVKISMITLVVVLMYWIDRALFPYARPDVFHPGPILAEAPYTDSLALVFVGSMLRRAIIVVGGMIAAALAF